MGRNTTVGLALVVLAIGSVTQAQAIAIYDSKVEFDLNFPGTITNTFGFATFGCSFPGGSGTSGVATVSTAAGCSDSLIGPPPAGKTPMPPLWPGSDALQSVTRTALAEVKGTAGPGVGTSIAAKDIFYTANLGNLTGSGGPTPPGQFLAAPFSGFYNYSLVTSTTNPTLEAANASVKIAVRVGGVVPAGWTDVVDKCSSAPNCNHNSGGNVPFNFTALLPANSVTPLTVEISDPSGDAEASSGPLVAVGDIVFVDEGQNGTSVFTVENLGADSTISSIVVAQQATEGDATDFANMTGIGGTCLVGNILLAGGKCSVVVDFVTDFPDPGPLDDGITPFDLTFSLDDGRAAMATQLVAVSDVPEPASIAVLASGFGALVMLRRRSRRIGRV
jgi:hypothetical protein